MKRFFVFFLLISISAISFSQIRIDWQQCYGSMKDDEVGNIIKKDNGYYVLGYVEEGESGMVECEFSGIRHTWLLEIDETGGLLKQHCFDFGANKILQSTRDPQALFLVGRNGVGVNNNENPSIMKITKDGDALWHRSFGAEDHNFWDGPKFTQTIDGGFVCSVSICFSGGDISHYYGFWDDWVVKLDSLCNIEWETTIGTAEGEFSGTVIANPDGTYLATSHGSPGESGSIPSCHKPYYCVDGIAVKLAPDGTIVESRCYGGSGDESFTTVTMLDDGYIFGGGANSEDGDLYGSGWHPGYNHLGTPNNDAWLLKTDYDGNIQWSRCYGGSGFDNVIKVFQNEDGGFTVFGTTDSYDGDVQSGMDYFVAYNVAFCRKLWVFRTDAEGNLVWERVIGHKGMEISLSDIIKESNKSYTLAATSVVGDNPDIMMDFNCTNSNLCHYFSYWVLHITDIFDYDGVEEGQIEEASISIYPNPAQGMLTVSGKDIRQVCLYDLLGQQVATAPSYNGSNAMLSTSGLAAGIYMVQVRTENGTCVKRVVVSE